VTNKTGFGFGDRIYWILEQLVAKTKQNFVALVRKQTIPTERPPLVGEVSVNFSGQRVSRGQRTESPWPLISVF
jgi:hypothetical protein